MNCQHDLAIGGGNICCKCGKELAFFKALGSLANANMGRPLLKLTEALKEAKIPMQKLSKELRKLELKSETSQ